MKTGVFSDHACICLAVLVKLALLLLKLGHCPEVGQVALVVVVHRVKVRALCAGGGCVVQVGMWACVYVCGWALCV